MSLYSYVGKSQYSDKSGLCLLAQDVLRQPSTGVEVVVGE